MSLLPPLRTSRLNSGVSNRFASRTDARVLFAGRPFLWNADGTADGAAVLDPSIFFGDVERWEGRLDGRGAVLRYGGDELSVVTDPLGCYPVYTTQAGASRWISNNVEASSAA